MALTTAAFSKKISQLLVNAEACESIAVQPCCSCDPDPALRLHAIADALWRSDSRQQANQIMKRLRGVGDFCGSQVQ